MHKKYHLPDPHPFLKIIKLFIIVTFLLSSSFADLSIANACAEEETKNQLMKQCDKLSENKMWQQLYQEAITHIEQKQWQRALDTLNHMNLICSHSPTINYLQGEVLWTLGKKEKSIQALKLALINTTKFSVDENFIERIYNARSRYEKKLNFAHQSFKIEQKIDMFRHSKKRAEQNISDLLRKNRQIIKTSQRDLLGWSIEAASMSLIAVATAGLIVGIVYLEGTKKRELPTNLPTNLVAASGTLLGVGLCGSATGIIILTW